MDSGYIQHNPNVPQGRDGFKQFMSRVPARTPQEIKLEWRNAPVQTESTAQPCLYANGAQRIHSASRELSVARKEMMKAHSRLDDSLSRGVVPEDLKRSG
jgi:hypothetical protein